MKRKDFIKEVTLGGSVLVAAPLFFNSCSKADITNPNSPGNGGEIVIDLTDPEYSALGSDGGYVYVGNTIVIRISSSNYVALSKICTHQGCEVFYSESSEQLPCPCHGSVFDINGNVVRGPAVIPLKMFSVTLSNNKLTIK